MKIFENPKKISNRLADQAESQYEYLRDSERPTARQVRDTIEQWFIVYCSVVHDIKKINDLRSRLQSKDNIQFFGAFTELYVFVLLKNFGYEITAEEKVKNERKPDFLVKTPDGKELYIEVTTFSEGEFNVKRTKAYKLITDKINKIIKSGDYAIRLDWDGQPIENDINLSILREIQEWINSPNNLVFVKKFNTWSLTLSAIKLSNSKSSNSDGIVASISNSKIQCYSNKHFQSDEEIENAGDFLSDIKEKTLTEKAKCYGDLGKPYIIILNLLSNYISESIVEDAILSETLKKGTRVSPPFFSKRTNVNAVLVSFNLNPFNMMDVAIPRKESLYFINPNASEDFNHCDFRSLFGDESSKENISRLDRKKLSAHLGLPQEEWNGALRNEDQGSKFEKAVNWMQNWVRENMPQESKN